LTITPGRSLPLPVPVPPRRFATPIAKVSRDHRLRHVLRTRSSTALSPRSGRCWPGRCSFERDTHHDPRTPMGTIVTSIAGDGEALAFDLSGDRAVAGTAA